MSKNKYQLIYLPLQPHGFDVDMITAGDSIKEGWITTPPMVPNWKPKWDGNQWIETATEEEMNLVVKETLTDIEKLQQENATLLERVDMLEAAVLEAVDLIAMNGGE